MVRSNIIRNLEEPELHLNLRRELQIPPTPFQSKARQSIADGPHPTPSATRQRRLRRLYSPRIRSRNYLAFLALRIAPLVWCRIAENTVRTILVFYRPRPFSVASIASRSDSTRSARSRSPTDRLIPHWSCIQSTHNTYTDTGSPLSAPYSSQHTDRDMARAT